MRITYKLRGVFALALLGLAANSLAHDEWGHMSRMWEITPKADARVEFKKAFEEHMAFRKANNDPWSWTILNASTGKGVNSVYARSNGHHWEDFDAYANSEFGKKASEHWNANVDPHVYKYDTWIDKSDSELYYWPEGSKFSHFYVTNFYLKPGHGREARMAVKAVHDELKAAGREAPHVWVWSQTGKPTFTVVTARENYAGFDWPEKSVGDTMRERVGEEKANAMFMDFFEHVKGQSSQIMVRDDKLSIEAAK